MSSDSYPPRNLAAERILLSQGFVIGVPTAQLSELEKHKIERLQGPEQLQRVLAEDMAYMVDIGACLCRDDTITILPYANENEKEAQPEYG